MRCPGVRAALQVIQRGLVPGLLPRRAFGGQPVGPGAAVGVVDAGQQGPAAQCDGIAEALRLHRECKSLEVSRDVPAQRVLAGLERLRTRHCVGLEDHLAQVAPGLAAAALGPKQRGHLFARQPLATAQRQHREQLKAPLGNKRRHAVRTQLRTNICRRSVSLNFVCILSH